MATPRYGSEDDWSGNSAWRRYGFMSDLRLCPSLSIRICHNRKNLRKQCRVECYVEKKGAQTQAFARRRYMIQTAWINKPGQTTLVFSSTYLCSLLVLLRSYHSSTHLRAIHYSYLFLPFQCLSTLLALWPYLLCRTNGNHQTVSRCALD